MCFPEHCDRIKYLGLPALVGAERSDCDCFRHLIGRVTSPISPWKEKMLSMGGKEILVKSIAPQADNGISIPKKHMQRNYKCYFVVLVGDDNEHNRIHWQEWQRMCLPKAKEGMGFRDLQSFNLASKISLEAAY